MDNKAIRVILEKILDKSRIFENEPMSRHTSFKAGGKAAFLVRPQTEEEIAQLIKSLKDHSYMVMGNGSNILFLDSGYEGVVIELGSNYSDILVDGACITAKSGALLSKIAGVAYENGLGGFEFASGIPGSLGGAVAMNAGAYGREMKDVIVSSTCIDGRGNIIEIDDHKFGYRHSLFTDSDLIVLKSVIRLEEKEKSLIKSEMNELNKKRREKQPLEYPGAGSTFKRPDGYFAGRLIEDAGLKGFRVGGAMVSEKHAGFVINYDGASACDIVNLIEHIKQEVYMRFGVELETEIKIVGKE